MLIFLSKEMYSLSKIHFFSLAEVEATLSQASSKDSLTMGGARNWSSSNNADDGSAPSQLPRQDPSTSPPSQVPRPEPPAALTQAPTAAASPVPGQDPLAAPNQVPREDPLTAGQEASVTPTPVAPSSAASEVRNASGTASAASKESRHSVVSQTSSKASSVRKSRKIRPCKFHTSLLDHC